MEERTERSEVGTFRLPMVPLRDIVVFPHTTVPFVVGRKSSLLAVERALDADKRLFLATQRDAKIDDPGPTDVNDVGSVATIVQHLKLPNGNVKLLVEGVERCRLLEVEAAEDGSFEVEVESIDVKDDTTPELQEQMTKVGNLFERFIKYSPGLPYETMLSTVRITDPGRLADTVAAHLSLSVEEKQGLLEMTSPSDRLEQVGRSLDEEIERLRVDKKIQNRVKKQMEKAQKEYYLNEKIKAIQQELGRRDDRVNEVDELREKVESAKMPADALEKANQELKRFEVMPPVSAEATVSRNYLEWLLAMPWTKRSRELRDIKKAQSILDTDHYGLGKVKERILEFLAVRQLVKKSRGSILCFVGPPGVGKTSLARSIARATGRKFSRLSLGGVRDEAEIRGHRRTYIGAFPGQIIQMMRKAGTRNPVFLLDEVDKMAADFRGDPSSALLEVLDPEQNHTFLDHYLDTEYDLSDVMFIATANVMHTIPAALRDRMEVIRLPGYTLAEKLAIAERYLVPKQLKEHGLVKKKLDVTFDKEALREIVERYTKEAGVRNLEREVAGVCRKLARQVVAKEISGEIHLTATKIVELLGVPHYMRPDENRRRPEIGVVAGLAWTQTGGEILIIEATSMRGRGRLTLTGQLGDVMQESAQAAMSFIRSRAEGLNIDPLFHRKSDIHVHLPEGAIPKDGPSAGIGLATAIASLLSGVPVDPNVAMTGEINLRGGILPIGGVKEKVLAAFRYGAKVVLLPKENAKDLAEIPEDVTAKLDIRLVETMDDVLEAALIEPVPNLALGDKGAEKKEMGGRGDSVTH
jgi:ATP-dependent Lon protease